MTETFIRFLVGGLFVSAFAVLGDVLKPKSFAGLFGAGNCITCQIYHDPASIGRLKFAVG